MAFRIKRAAVLGAGVMGSAIAAHLANAGVPSVLLDIFPPELSEADRPKRPLSLRQRAEGETVLRRVTSGAAAEFP